MQKIAAARRIAAATFVLAATTVILGYAGAGLGNGVLNMVGAALRQLVVLVPCAWLLARFGGVGAIWYALWAAEAAAAVYSALAFRRELRRKVEPLRPAR